MLFKGFMQVANPKIRIASAVPVLAALAWSLGLHTKALSPLWFVVAMVGVFLVEIAKDALNKVVDWHSNADDEHRTPFSGGKKAIVQGRLPLFLVSRHRGYLYGYTRLFFC